MNIAIQTLLFTIALIIVLSIESVIGLPFVSLWGFANFSERLPQFWYSLTLIVMIFLLAVLFPIPIWVSACVMGGSQLILEFFNQKTITSSASRERRKQLVSALVTSSFIAFLSGVSLTPILIVYLLVVLVIVLWRRKKW